MIFEQELKDKGFEIRDDQLYYEFSDFELIVINQAVATEGGCNVELLLRGRQPRRL